MELKKLERCQKFAKKFLTLPFRSYWSLICDSRCLVNQTFFLLCFLRQSWSPTIRMGVTWGTLFNWGVSGWGIGRLCGGVGGWSSRLEAPPKPRPRHQAPTEVPEGSSANSSPHQPICHHQQACLWRIQGKWFAAPIITTNVCGKSGHPTDAHQMHFPENTFQLLHTDNKPKPSHFQLTFNKTKLG